MEELQVLCESLEATFQLAVQALQSEEQNDSCSAANSYFLARSRIRYALEAILQPLAEQDSAGPDLVIVLEACRQLEATYDQAIERLNREPSSELGTGDALGSTQHPCSEQLGPVPPNGCEGSQFESRDAGCGLQEARRRGQQPDVPKDLMETAKRCQREVQGSLEEVVGLEGIKQELREAVLLPMHLPHLFTGIRRPQCNIMFHGVPGTGKTMLVEKVAAEAGIPLLCISPSAILSKWSGDSEKTLRTVFEVAAHMSPAIIFLDEVDSLAPARSSGDDLSSRRVLTELLIQMTNTTNKPGCLVYVMACTNRIMDCDPALLRRFDRKVEVPAPDAAARKAFFLATVQRPEIASTLSAQELDTLSSATDGCTGSDLAIICREAAMAPLRELMREMQAAMAQGRQVHEQLLSQATVREVMFADFQAAVAKIAPPAGFDGDEQG